MTLIRLDDALLDLGHGPLLDRASIMLREGEHVGLLGRNGAGKSTLLRVLAGELALDQGERIVQQETRIAMMPQHIPSYPSQTPWQVVAQGVPVVGSLLAQARSSEKIDVAIQERLNELEAWHWLQRVDQQCSYWHLPAGDYERLSGGQKRLCVLAQALVSEPHVLLLDEPTNHLDMVKIDQLTQFLKHWQGAFVMTTHDRSMIEATADHIWDVHQGQCQRWSCGYTKFLERREALWEAQETEMARQRKKLSAEEAWLRQGVKARRKRNQGRLRALRALREQCTQRSHNQQARIRGQDAFSSAYHLIKAKDIAAGWGEQPCFGPLDVDICRGDKWAVVGPNGCGKTTLLRALLKTIPLKQGHIKHADQLQVTYFDQMRQSLRDDLSVQDNVSGGNSHVVFMGKKIHVSRYLQDFLFRPDQFRAGASKLSGGERHRLMLAKLFLQPAHLMVLDEPTNDLDIETLELLEAMLVSFKGAVIVVSHDRRFIENVATSCLMFKAPGHVEIRNGDVGDFDFSGFAAPTRSKATKMTHKPRRKMSYREQQELKAMPETIASLEAEYEQGCQQLSDPDYYASQPPEACTTLQKTVQALESNIQAAYDRWAALEEKSQS